jgi:ribonucleoside-diphosphate reductase alpha chain
MWNNNWKKGIDYPNWGDTDVYKKTIAGGYLINSESPRDAYMRVCTTVAKRLDRPELAETFFEYVWKGWLCLASPVLSNTGTDRGLPISCFGIDVADSIYDIGMKNLEMMLEIKKQEANGESYYKSVKQLESLIFYLKEIQTKVIQMLTESTD